MPLAYCDTTVAKSTSLLSLSWYSKDDNALIMACVPAGIFSLVLVPVIFTPFACSVANTPILVAPLEPYKPLIILVIIPPIYAVLLVNVLPPTLTFCKEAKLANAVKS